MGLHGAKDIESRFGRYVDQLVSVIGHADRAGPFHDYCTGLVMPGERKSVEPMAAITAPGRTAAQHQSLLHFVGQAAWSDDAVLTKVRQMVLPQITRDGPIEAWIIDDTGLPKKGQHSVGVSHQYCGQLGKQANCQVAVTLSLANRHASLPVAYRLYLPSAWAEDDDRRAKAGVPEEITFKTKPQIALEQIRWACEVGLPGNWWTPATATIPSCARVSLSLESAMWPAFSRRCWCGSRPSGRAAHRRRVSVTRPMRSRSRTSPSDCGTALGAPSNGGRAPMNGCARGLRVCVFTLHRAINGPANRPKNGC